MTPADAVVDLSSAWAVLAHAEGGVAGPRGWAELGRAWTLDPLVLVLLAGTGWMYRRGSSRLREKVGRGRGVRSWEIASFWMGWGTLVLALVTPLHAWGRVLFSAHMTQHELLMLVAAPLLVLGRPLVALMFALPRADARQLSRVARVPAVNRVWRGLRRPLIAWALHAAALWVWHVPRFFEATLTSEFVHDLQHASFFGSALLFWWALLHVGPGMMGCGVAILYLFTTMLHSGLLGALLTFAERLVYPSYQYTVSDWSLTALEDQQLGGVIMWVPAGLVYIVAALALIAGWMRASERRASGSPRLVAAARGATGLLVALLFVGCGGNGERVAAAYTGGDPRQGRETIHAVGCGACHTIPGVPGANALIGPPLAGVAGRN